MHQGEVVSSSADPLSPHPLSCAQDNLSRPPTYTTIQATVNSFMKRMLEAAGRSINIGGQLVIDYFRNASDRWTPPSKGRKRSRRVAEPASQDAAEKAPMIVTHLSSLSLLRGPCQIKDTSIDSVYKGCVDMWGTRRLGPGKLCVDGQTKTAFWINDKPYPLREVMSLLPEAEPLTSPVRVDCISRRFFEVSCTFCGTSEDVEPPLNLSQEDLRCVMATRVQFNARLIIPPLPPPPLFNGFRLLPTTHLPRQHVQGAAVRVLVRTRYSRPSLLRGYDRGVSKHYHVQAHVRHQGLRRRNGPHGETRPRMGRGFSQVRLGSDVGYTYEEANR